jgi:phosphoribosylaminoimidazolecarboxamide formyltransferase/IMP cyclohydrolase
MQGGLVKTLDFKIYLGLLGEHYNEAHQADLKRTGAVEIDMVVCNLYPFEKVSSEPGVSPEKCRSNIDIGGPCMCRASAKNYIRVSSVTDPADYEAILSELRDNDGTISFATRFRLMKKAFRHTATYDKAIADHFATIDDPSTVYEFA